jgi:hypothetical protein
MSAQIDSQALNAITRIINHRFGIDAWRDDTFEANDYEQGDSISVIQEIVEVLRSHEKESNYSTEQLEGSN